MKPIKIYNADTYELLGEFDDYISAIWTNRYDAYGECEVRLPPNHPMIPLLKVNRMLELDSGRGKNHTHQMVIVGLEFEENPDQDSIVVYGHSLVAWLDQRYYHRYFSSGVNERSEVEHLKFYLDYVMGEYGAARRLFATYTVDISSTVPEFSSESVMFGPGQSWYEIAQKVLKNKNLGIRWTRVNSVYGRITIYKGVNRRAWDTQNQSVIFSEELGNINKIRYVESIRDEKNVTAYQILSRDRPTNVPGTEGFVWVGSSQPTGVARRETFYDGAEVVDDSLTTSRQNSAARLNARNLLSQHRKEHYVDIETTPITGYEYGLNDPEKTNYVYGLGDTVSVISPFTTESEYRIVEVIENYGPDGEYVYPTLRKDDV